MNKILVTGGAGFIGSKVAANLIEEGYEVHTIDNLSTGQENNLPNGIKFYKGDCSDEKLTNKLLKKISLTQYFILQVRARVRFLLKTLKKT